MNLRHVCSTCLRQQRQLSTPSLRLQIDTIATSAFPGSAFAGSRTLPSLPQTPGCRRFKSTINFRKVVSIKKARLKSTKTPDVKPVRVRRVNSTVTSPERLRSPKGPAENDASDEAEDEIADSSFGTTLNIAKLDPEQMTTLTGDDITLQPLEVEDIDVPRLSSDLSRVLFNPGVYHLQDPRSRVYNFDPYLEKIMPVTEFNFDALNEYITSSADDKLHQLATGQESRYIGSSSSMTSSLAHFHYLISAFRPLNISMLSKGFRAESQRITRLLRAPSAAFLRYKDGVYAMDADKEFESGNILLSLGKSIEKLLTMEKDDFEKYRKSEASDESSLPESPPEQYHYGKIGKFLMRSQLDAYDERLPGTGVFDLKTRAVASIRFSISDHEQGVGYEIRNRLGTWESFEREYYDMIRSAFLKYSLQVRIGRMDGIFVAFHNIARIFGFQYIPLSEMDLALHGQSDECLGDREFGFSVKMLEDVLDRATAKYPGQSLRLHFEAREPTPVQNPVTYMYVFAEAMTEEAIDEIQHKNRAELEEYERRLYAGIAQKETKPAMKTEDASPPQAPDVSATSTPLKPASSEDADSTFLDSVSAIDLGSTDEAAAGDQEGNGASEQASADAPAEDESSSLTGFKIVIRNEFNGQYVGRVEDMSATDQWQLDYTITELSAAQAITKYRACQARRERALSAMKIGADDQDAFRDYLKLLTLNGRAWREERDWMDAQKGPPVVYETAR